MACSGEPTEHRKQGGGIVYTARDMQLSNICIKLHSLPNMVRDSRGLGNIYVDEIYIDYYY